MGASPVSACTRPPTNDCGVLRITNRYNLVQFDQSIMDGVPLWGVALSPRMLCSAGHLITFASKAVFLDDSG